MSDRLPVIVPDLQVGQVPVVLGQWHVEPGEQVLAGDLLLELVLPGLTVSVSCPADGVLTEICRPANSVLRPGEFLAWVAPETVTRDDAVGG